MTTHTLESLLKLVPAEIQEYPEFISALSEVMAKRDTLAKDAARWVGLCELLNNEKATVTFLGRVDTIHTGLEVFDSGDLHDEIEIAMKGTP